MFSSIGPMELVIVLVIALIVLGPKRLPEAGRSLGQGLRAFKTSLEGRGGDDRDELEAEHETTAAAPRSDHAAK